MACGRSNNISSKGNLLPLESKWRNMSKNKKAAASKERVNQAHLLWGHLETNLATMAGPYKESAKAESLNVTSEPSFAA